LSQTILSRDRRVGSETRLREGERLLAAIMFTDIVGYTKLTQTNESLALQLLDEHREMVRPFISRHNGKEIKTMGDSFLVEFPSALEAVRCAFDIQQSLHEMNASRRDEKKVVLRVGVHLGDVIHRKNDVYGDAVNIASRIEPLAEPGGVCVTGSVYDQIKNKFEFPFSSLGKKELKNVGDTTEVYRMVLPWQKNEPSKARYDQHRLAVLPLSNISPNPNDAYFADGMTEELITVLSQLQDLRVIARTSVDHYKGKEKRVSQIAEELQVGTLMEGSVRMAGERIRVTLQLINANNEEHIWSENYDRKLDDIFAIQSDIARQVAQSLKMKLLEAEKERLTGRASDNVSAYVKYLKGRGLLATRKPNDLKEAKTLFEATIAEDPDFAPGYSGLADVYFLLGEYFELPTKLARQKARELVTKALQLDPGIAEAHATRGMFLMGDYEHEQAKAEFEEAIRLNPSYASAHLWYSYCLGALGRLEQALDEMGLAQDADPLSILVLYNEFGYLSVLGRKDKASKTLKKLLEIDPHSWMTKDAVATDHYLKGEYEKSIKIALSLEETNKLNKSDNPIFKAGLASTYAVIGDQENAIKWLRQLISVPEGTAWRNWLIAGVYAALGDSDEFFTFANRAFNEKTLTFIDVRLIDKWIPNARKIREDPRFGELFKKARLQLDSDV
jgi:adenylate cyclase